MSSVGRIVSIPARVSSSARAETLPSSSSSSSLLRATNASQLQQDLFLAFQDEIFGKSGCPPPTDVSLAGIRARRQRLLDAEAQQQVDADRLHKEILEVCLERHHERVNRPDLPVLVRESRPLIKVWSKQNGWLQKVAAFIINLQDGAFWIFAVLYFWFEVYHRQNVYNQNELLITGRKIELKSKRYEVEVGRQHPLPAPKADPRDALPTHTEPVEIEYPTNPFAVPRGIWRPRYEPVVVKSSRDLCSMAMLMNESAPVPMAVPSQQLILPTSIPAALPAPTPAAEPSLLDQLCLVFSRLTIQCAYTPLALVQARSLDMPQQFGRPAHDLQPAALTLAPRLPGVPSLVKPSVTAPAVATQQDMEIVPVSPVGQLPLPAGQLPFPPMAPITIPALAVPTPVAAPVSVAAPPTSVVTVQPQQAAVQPVRNQAVVAPTNQVIKQIKQLPKSELAVPKRRAQQPSSSVQPPAAQIRRNTPAGPLNLVIERPAPATMISHPQQPVPAAPQQQQQLVPAPAPVPKPKPAIPSRPNWKPIVRLSSAEAQAKLTLPTLALPAPAPVVPVPVTPAFPAAAAPTPAVPAPPVAPTFVFSAPAPAPAPAPPTAPIVIDDDEPPTGPVIPPNGSRPLATMRRRRAFGNTVPPPPDASVLGPLRHSDQPVDPELRDTDPKRRRPVPSSDDGDAVPAFLPSGPPVMKVLDQQPPVESSIAQQSPVDAPKPTWYGLELRTLAGRLINECIDIDAWRRDLEDGVEDYIGGEEDDDDVFEAETAVEMIKCLFRHVRQSEVGSYKQKDNTCNKVIRIARRNGLVIEKL